MRVTIEIIDHKSQRVPGVGDWFFDADDNLTIRVSRLSDWRREMLVAIHELVEVVLCKQAGVTQQAVDKFDTEFEAHRHPDNVDEPGDEPSAPYVKQHCVASGVERILAAELGVSWKEYADEIESL